MTEKVILPIRGFCEFKSIDREGNVTHLGKHNIVVNNCRKIIRDLVYGKRVTKGQDGTLTEAPNPPTITHLVVGDMGLTLEDAQKGVVEPTVDESKLVNATLWIPVTDETNWPNNKKEPIEYQGLNAIRYTFVLAKEQANNIGFFCELGLAINNTENPNDYLFTKLNKKPIIKTEDNELVMQYTLIF